MTGSLIRKTTKSMLIEWSRAFFVAVLLLATFASTVSAQMEGDRADVTDSSAPADDEVGTFQGCEIHHNPQPMHVQVKPNGDIVKFYDDDPECAEIGVAGNICRYVECDATVGRCHVPVLLQPDCDDGDGCTVDTCDPVAGCEYENICGNCEADFNGDGNKEWGITKEITCELPAGSDTCRALIIDLAGAPFAGGLFNFGVSRSAYERVRTMAYALSLQGCRVQYVNVFDFAWENQCSALARYSYHSARYLSFPQIFDHQAMEHLNEDGSLKNLSYRYPGSLDGEEGSYNGRQIFSQLLAPSSPMSIYLADHHPIFYPLWIDYFVSREPRSVKNDKLQYHFHIPALIKFLKSFPQTIQLGEEIDNLSLSLQAQLNISASFDDPGTPFDQEFTRSFQDGLVDIFQQHSVEFSNFQREYQKIIRQCSDALQFPWEKFRYWAPEEEQIWRMMNRLSNSLPDHESVAGEWALWGMEKNLMLGIGGQINFLGNYPPDVKPVNTLITWVNGHGSDRRDPHYFGMWGSHNSTWKEFVTEKNFYGGELTLARGKIPFFMHEFRVKRFVSDKPSLCNYYGFDYSCSSGLFLDLMAGRMSECKLTYAGLINSVSSSSSSTELCIPGGWVDEEIVEAMSNFINNLSFPDSIEICTSGGGANSRDLQGGSQCAWPEGRRWNYFFDMQTPRYLEIDGYLLCEECTT